MTIIDRYLLRRFVQNFLICFSSLMGLWIVIELSTNLDEFTRCGGKSGGVVFLAADYYGYKALGIFDQLAGMLAMVAAMFTISWIQRHNEMTALMALGVPRIRIVRPILIAGKRRHLACGREPRTADPAISQRNLAAAAGPDRRSPSSVRLVLRQRNGCDPQRQKRVWRPAAH